MRRSRQIRDLGVAGAVVMAVVAVAFAVTSGGSPTHRLWVRIPDATGLLVGEPIRDAGVKVGSVSYLDTVHGGRGARVGLTITAKAWPVPRGTIFHLRWGGTVSYLNDYVDLLRPAHAGADYVGGTTIPSSAFTVPVAFDTLINDFTPGVRRGVKALLNHGGAALGAAASGLRGTIEQTSPALVQANALLGDLDSSSQQLKSTINAAADVVDAFESSQPTTEQLVSGAGQTLQTVGDRATALEQTLSRAPSTFEDIDATLGSADRTLDLADRVTGEVAPGVSQLRHTVAPLQRLLTRVMDVAPNARDTLSTLAGHAPEITAVLNKANALMPAINSTVTNVNPELDCIRPYTPDIVALTTNWGRFISSTDGSDYYARILPSEIVPALSTAQAETPQQAVQEDPGLTDSFPRPPGESADQSWFLPECRITADSLNPADDPEANNSDDTPLPAVNHPENSR